MLQTGTPVNGAHVEGNRVTEIQIGEDWVSTNTVVIAAGSWSRQIGDIFGLTIPVEPARGQMLAIRASPLHHVVSWSEVYLVPRKNGETIIGSNVAFVGYNKDVTLDAIREFINHAEALVPGIGRSPLSRFWAGLRPYSPTRRPILCRAPGLENVIIATGHHRNGIVLAPITGKLISELITTGQTSLSLDPFGLPREPLPPPPADESPDEAD
jgi:glycine/D-amino acid oxidase-like deaminating enzyme